MGALRRGPFLTSLEPFPKPCAAVDAELLEIDAAQFRERAVARPELIEHVSAIVSARRQGLADAKAAADGALASAPARVSLPTHPALPAPLTAAHRSRLSGS